MEEKFLKIMKEELKLLEINSKKTIPLLQDLNKLNLSNLTDKKTHVKIDEIVNDDFVKDTIARITYRILYLYNLEGKEYLMDIGENHTELRHEDFFTVFLLSLHSHKLIGGVFE